VTNDDAEHLDPDVPTERRFGRSNVFVAPDEDPRSEATSVGERATLIERGHSSNPCNVSAVTPPASPR
jgi:hypothetical protein